MGSPSSGGHPLREWCVKLKTKIIWAVSMWVFVVILITMASLAAQRDTYALISAVVWACLTGWMALHYKVVSRLRAFYEDAKAVEADETLTRRFGVLGNGELDSVAGIVNRVLDNLQDYRRRTQEQETHTRIQIAAVNASTDHIIITDPQGLIVFANPSFQKETGYSLDELRGRHAGEIMLADVDDINIDEVSKRVFGGESWRRELRMARADGSIYVADVTMVPVTDDDGQVEFMLSVQRNIDEQKTYENQIRHYAYHDVLTGLPNRLAFAERLSSALAQARRGNDLLGVMFIDLDRFKFINDTLGHDVGDELLVAVAERLGSCLREGDSLARMGGDEFTVILPNLKACEDSGEVARRIIEAISKEFVVGGHDLFISGSIGISFFPTHGTDVLTLVKNADTAMYKAKEAGHGTFEIYSLAMNDRAVEKMKMEVSLRRAVEQEEFVVCYQPIVDIMSGQVLGAEALVRWDHPEFGTVSPADFIPLAEETGLITQIGQWVLRVACRDNRKWLDAGLGPVQVSVNVSPKQFQQDPPITETVKMALADTGLDPALLNVEITEGTLMGRENQVIGLLGELRHMGVTISIDDFGTGYSSLSYLKRFPIDTVKIDGSFVREISTNDDDVAIAAAIVGVAHNLRMKVVAECVESYDQLQVLQSLTCDEMQGYLVSPPLPDTAFREFLQAQKCRAA